MKYLGAYVIAAVICGSLGACGGDDGAVGGNGLSTLLLGSVEPAGAQCSSGGTRIDAGLDANANRTLDSTEVSSTQYVCNGATGAATRVLMSNEPPGAQCAAGGKKIEAGPDSNASGTLDAAEVVSTAYVCNGAAGTAGVDGSNGHNSLMSVAAEAAGLNCTHGGNLVRSGVDLNDNGILDGVEITASGYACNGAPGATGATGPVGPAGPGVSWVLVNGTSQQAQSNTGYVADNAAEVAITLPANPAVGDVIQVTGAGAGGWRIRQNAAQVVHTANTASVAGVAWTARDSNRLWWSIASSSDGSRLVAVEYAGQIYTSTDSGLTWTARDSNRNWVAVASSADGNNLVAAEQGGQIYTSTDAGATWTARDSNRGWNAVASSADGTRLVAVVYPGQIYTSTDSGVTWFARESSRTWADVASSADGTRLVATVENGQVYTSTDGGVSWTARDSNRNWFHVRSSADGMRLVAGVRNGNLYTSTDSGATWTARESSRDWWGVTSSADGVRLAATEMGGNIYTSTDSGATWKAREAGRSWGNLVSSADGTKLAALELGGRIYTSAPMLNTTTGTTGSIAGRQYDAIALQCIAPNEFTVLYSAGTFEIN